MFINLKSFICKCYGFKGNCCMKRMLILPCSSCFLLSVLPTPHIFSVFIAIFTMCSFISFFISCFSCIKNVVLSMIANERIFRLQMLLIVIEYFYKMVLWKNTFNILSFCSYLALPRQARTDYVYYSFFFFFSIQYCLQNAIYSCRHS